MSGSDLILLGALVIMGVGFAAMAVLFPLWFVLHRILSRFDDSLLREPYFTRSEQINCRVWPFNYWKTGIYFTLIAAPGISRRKRFKGLVETPRVNKATTVACKVQIGLMGLCGILFIVYALYLLFGLYIYPNL